MFKDLDALDPLARGAEPEAPDAPPFLRFDPEALEAFTEWCTGFEAELRTGDLYPALESHLADSHHSPVGFTSTPRALHWGVYLQTYARRVTGWPSRARWILDWARKGDLLREGFGTRDIQRAGWSGLTEPRRVVDGLGLLVELGHMEKWQEPSRTKPRALYVVNPKSVPVRH